MKRGVCLKKLLKYTAAFSLATSLLSPSLTGATTIRQTTLSKNLSPFSGKIASILKKPSPLSFQNERNEINENTYVVKYNGEFSSTLHKRAGMTIVKSFPSLHYDIVKLQPGKKLQGALNVYDQTSSVTSVSPSILFKPLAIANPNPKEENAYYLSQLHIPAAQKLVKKQSITVAVIDQGVDTQHPDLSGRILSTYNVVNPANKGRREFHGTHVAGIIAADKDNGIGAYGINPNAKILSVNVFDGNDYTSDYTIAQGILYAVDHGAKVINMSIGGTLYSQLLDDTIQYAISKGVVVVAAAGNSGTNEYSYPASYDGVISVGATNDQKKLATFSTYGPGVDVVAPGDNIYSTIYDPSIGSTYYYLSGTSMATPVVSGVASLLKTKYPNLTSYDIEQILEETATDLGTKGYDIKYGYGLINPINALNFNISKLQKYNKTSSATILSSAMPLTLSDQGESSANGSIKKAHQIDRYKIAVKAGDEVGLSLSTAKDYDQKLVIHFYDQTNKETRKTVGIDDVLAGQEEGTVYRATAEGTVVVEVMDKNARYNSSDTYSLKIKKSVEQDPTEATMQNPLAVSELPFSTNNLKGNSIDLFNKDSRGTRYFAYKAIKDESLLLSLNAIPGLNTSINVYTKEQWGKFVGTPNARQPLPLYTLDRSGTSEGEKGALPLKKDTDYVFEVSSTPITVFTLPKYGDQPGDDSIDLPASLDSISFQIKELALPDDEDGLINTAYKMDIASGKLDPLYDSTPIDEDTVGMDTDAVKDILNKAIPLTNNAGKTAYIQSENDVDWYTFTPNQDELSQFTLHGTKDQQFNAQIYQYNDADQMFEYISSSYKYFPDGKYGEENQDLISTLEKNKKYYIRISSFDGVTDLPYTLTAKTIDTVQKDASEPNSTFERATNIGNYKEVSGNFSSSKDIDYYYYKNTSTKDLLKGFEFIAIPLGDDETGKIPKMLTDDTLINITVYEDSNGNKKLDPEEEEKSSYYGNYGNFTKGSFVAKPKRGYFFEISNGYSDIPNIHAYGFRLYSMNRVDEDAKAKYKNGIPSIRLPLQSINKTTLAGTGYLNAGVAGGDKDFFTFTNDQNRRINFRLTMPAPGMNGKVTFYDAKGKYITSFNRYTFNDDEEGSIYLRKGTYFIKVEDADGQSDYDQYELDIMK
jgi:subtilisin family serine protease